MSDLVAAPLIGAFQQRYSKVRVHCLVTERYIDYIADGIDLSIRGGQWKIARYSFSSVLPRAK